MKRHRRYAAADFIEDPLLFPAVQSAWTRNDWAMLLGPGQWPVGAVLATLEDGGIVFHWQVLPAGVGEEE